MIGQLQWSGWFWSNINHDALGIIQTQWYQKHPHCQGTWVSFLFFLEYYAILRTCFHTKLKNLIDVNQNSQFKSDFALHIPLIHSLLCSTFCWTLRTLIQVSICPPILPTITCLTGLCLVTLPSLYLAKLQYFQRALDFLVGREDEQCCLIFSIGIIAFFLNPLGSQFAASEVWSFIMMGYWPVCCLATRTEANWKDSSCFPCDIQMASWCLG